MFSRSSSVLCTVYVSTSVPSLLTSFRSSVADSLVHSFPDTAYNRTSFYLMSTSKKSLEGAHFLFQVQMTHPYSTLLYPTLPYPTLLYPILHYPTLPSSHTSTQTLNSFHPLDQALLLCQKAVDSLDFRQHSGTHPTLGIIDNIVFSPMGEESIESTTGMLLPSSYLLFYVLYFDILIVIIIYIYIYICKLVHPSRYCTIFCGEVAWEYKSTYLLLRCSFY